MSVFESVCLLLGGVGVFLAGMKFMSDGLCESALSRIKNAFLKLNDKPLACYGIGASVTAVMQSSSASVVMCMGLADSGVLSVYQGSAFALGARFGTTLTGALVALSAFNVTPVFTTLGFFGIIGILASGNEKISALCKVFGGFGILFAGTELMSLAVSSQKQIADFFINMFVTVDFPPLLILLGTLFTAVIQSSGATVGILMTLLSSGAVTLSQATFITVGATVGTTMTAVIASFGSKLSGKRIMLFHVLSSIIGALAVGSLYFIISPYVLPALETFTYKQWALVTFDVVYSLASSAFCLIFLPEISRFACSRRFFARKRRINFYLSKRKG